MTNQSYDAYFNQLTYESQTDKVLGKQYEKLLLKLLKKEVLDPKDLSMLKNLLVSDELKTLNLSDNERYIAGLYLTWLLRVISANIVLTEFIDSNEYKLKLEKEAQEILKSLKKDMDMVVKQLTPIYFYITRSSLSKDGWAFDILNKYRYEYFYPTTPQTGQLPEQRKTFFSIKL